MTDPISLQAGQGLTVGAGGGNSFNNPGVADAGDVFEFESIYNNDIQGIDGNSLQIGNTQPMPDTAAEMLVQKVDQLSDNFDRGLERIGEVVNADPMTMSTQELFQVQLEMLSLDLTTNVSSKVGDKMSQGVQTLFRNQ